MFSKEILKSDIQQLDTLKRQRDNCKTLITASLQEFMISDNLPRSYIDQEKSAIQSIYDQFLDLENQITTLEEQMFLNYANNHRIKNSHSGQPSFPHFDTITS